MKIKYLGPSDSVNVAPFGVHFRGQVQEYPDEFGEELLATSRKQSFEMVEAVTDPENMTVAQLKAELGKDAEIPPKAKHADLVEMVKPHREKSGKAGNDGSDAQQGQAGKDGK